MEINRLCPHCMKETAGEKGKVCTYCGHRFDDRKEIQHQLKPFTILAGKYLVGDVLGEGGFGITYIGFDLNLEIRIAIKEFYPNGFAMREANVTNELTAYTGQSMDVVYKWRDNFLKEARSLAKCAHLPGVVGVRDFFQENNTAYIVQEYIEGMTLKDYMQSEGGKIAPQQLLPSLEPVLKALSQVHREGIIHRDISPDNIMIMEDGQMKLLDFGAARDFGQEGEKSLSVLLKPGYAPEEQYRTKGKQGPWTDIYAFAGTVYKCLTGVTPPESMERMRKDELKSLGELGAAVEPHVEQALRKAMAVYAEDRYQNVEDFCRDLYGGDRTTTAVLPENQCSEPIQEQPSAVPQVQKADADTAKKGNKIIAAAVAAASVAAVAGLLVFSPFGKSGETDTGPASTQQSETGAGSAGVQQSETDKQTSGIQSDADGNAAEKTADDYETDADNQQDGQEGQSVDASQEEGEKLLFTFQKQNHRFMSWDEENTEAVFYEEDSSGSFREIGRAAVPDGKYKIAGRGSAKLKTVEERKYYEYVMSFGYFPAESSCEAASAEEAYELLEGTDTGEDDTAQMFQVSDSSREAYDGYGASEDNLVVGQYQYYDSGISDFAFSYPLFTFYQVKYDDSSKKNVFGKNIQSIFFTGAEGGSLLFRISRREDGRSLEQMEDYAYQQEADTMSEAARLTSSVKNGIARVVLTGYANGGKIVYEVMKIEPEYVMQMKLITPPWENEGDKQDKCYLTECIYRMCQFSGSDKWVRSYDEYVQAQ